MLYASSALMFVTTILGCIMCGVAFFSPPSFPVIGVSGSVPSEAISALIERHHLLHVDGTVLLAGLGYYASRRGIALEEHRALFLTTSFKRDCAWLIHRDNLALSCFNQPVVSSKLEDHWYKVEESPIADTQTLKLFLRQHGRDFQQQARRAGYKGILLTGSGVGTGLLYKETTTIYIPMEMGDPRYHDPTPGAVILAGSREQVLQGLFQTVAQLRCFRQTVPRLTVLKGT
ncbi:hypothetical protein GMRT_15298 [Giardia muris]|uniref:Uncharacterized protein n=1 Tax=Giardia muris TaxID=5742 RepID=A0A4Z1T8G9_GIAMU|nr:hypothetical protein GMRT_15298 [Giardia muris]|eukprot:TNJ28879.1 hypothetical protein GMRT_15298 [Giardia muris]